MARKLGNGDWRKLNNKQLHIMYISTANPVEQFAIIITVHFTIMQHFPKPSLECDIFSVISAKVGTKFAAKRWALVQIFNDNIFHEQQQLLNFHSFIINNNNNNNYSIILKCSTKQWGSWLRHYATSQKVMSLNRNKVNWIFQFM
jgi:hypothetical protein